MTRQQKLWQALPMFRIRLHECIEQPSGRQYQMVSAGVPTYTGSEYLVVLHQYVVVPN